MPRRPSNRTKSAPTSHRHRRTLREAGLVQDVVVRAMRLGDALASHLDKFLSEYGLTVQQYNVLRILYRRDPDRKGLRSGTFGPLLARRTPDVPRLLDRLVKAGLLERVRSDEDRRVVRVRLTDEGLDLVERVNDPLFDRDAELVADLPESTLRRLAKDLEAALASVHANGRAADAEG